MNSILTGDAMAVLPTLEAGSVQTNSALVRIIFI